MTLRNAPRFALPALLLFGCGPPSSWVEYQHAHEAEWISPMLLPRALEGLTEESLRITMGVPMSRTTTISEGVVYEHNDYCRLLRTFHENHEDRQYRWQDGAWRPWRWQRCTRVDRIRVLVANGHVMGLE